MLRRATWLVALVLTVLALTVCLPTVAASTQGPETGPTPASLALVSPLGPYSPLPTPTPGLATASPTATPVLTPTPTGFPTVSVAEPPFIPGLEAVTPEPFQVIVREGDRVWLVTDEGERELLVDTVTRLGLYLGPGGLLETDMPAVGWGGPTADGSTLVLAVGTYPNRPQPETDPPFQVRLYLLEVSSGLLRYLTDGEDPVISPDGSRVVFRRPDEGWYLVEAASGSLPQPLPAPASGCHLRGFLWSPSGDRLAVTEYCPAEARIDLLDPDTGDFTRLHSVGYGDMEIQLSPDTYLAWSPDGQYLTYLALERQAREDRQQSLWRLPIAGGPPQQVTSGLPVWTYSISPDGQWVGLSALSEYGAERTVLELWLADVTGSVLQRLTRDEPYDWPLGWAPDGTRMVFRRDPQGVWTLDLTDGLMRQVFRDAPGARWHPSSETVSGAWQEPWPSPGWGAYEGEPFSLLVERDEELWLVDTGQGAERRLLTLPYAYYWTLGEVVISPDGTRVAYSVHNRFGPTFWSGHVGFIELGATTDGSPQEVAQTGRATDLAWLDSTHLTYLAWDSLAPVLVVVDLVTGERTEERTDVLRYPSPDGRYVLIRTGLRSEPRLYVLKDTATGRHLLATGPEEEAQFLGWSAEGNLLFVISPPGIEGSVLAVVDPEGGVRRELTSGQERITGAAWSPDGRTIAYAMCRPAQAGCHSPQLRLVSPDGSDERAVPMEEYLSQEEGFPPNRIYAIEDLGWSPEGEYIVFRCRHGFRVAEDVWAVRPDGSGLVPLAQGERPAVAHGLAGRGAEPPH